MEYLGWLVAIVYGFLFIKALARFALCNFSVKLFLSESTYAWMGFFFLFNLVIVIIGAFSMAIGAMVAATL